MTTSPQAGAQETDAAVPENVTAGSDEGAKTLAAEGPFDVAAKLAEFAEMSLKAELTDSRSGEGDGSAAGRAAGLNRLLDVAVTVSVELGRVTISIGEILKLGIGSVLPLDRFISEPVDLTAQGIVLARGEVVVVEDHFAIRIKDITDPKKRS